MNDLFNTPEINWHALRPVLDEVLRELGESDREAVLLRYFEQRPFAEIGRVLSVSEDAARMRVDRALEKLRSLLARRGVSSTAAALAAVLGHQVVAAPAGLAASIASTVTGSAIATGAVATIAKTFMSTTNLITTSIAAVAIGTAVFETNEARNRSAELSALQSRLSDVNTRLAQTTRHSAELEAQLSASQPPAKVASAGADATPPPAAAAELDEVTQERLKKNTAEQRLTEITHVLSQYDGLFKTLGLSAAAETDLKTLLIDNVGRHFDLGTIARTQGLKPVDPDIAALSVQADADLATKVRAAFGDSVYQTLQHYDQTAPMRELTGHVAAVLATTSPLTSDQANQLVEILNSNRIPDAQGHLTSDPHAINLDAVLTQAQTFLSPAQLTALRQVQEDRR